MRIAPLVVGLGTAAVCARLGVWQVDRLAQRRAWNAEVEARLAAPPLTVTSGLTATPPESLTYRRVEARGVFAFADEQVEPNRSFRGAPGVYVVTPLRFADGTGILVQRGFTYAPDGMTVDLAAVAEPESTVVRGILLAPTGRGAVHPDTAQVGYPLFPLVVRRTQVDTGLPARLALVGPPVLDEGPHLSYAIQWFSFALIALVGGVLLARRVGADVAHPPEDSTAAD